MIPSEQSTLPISVNKTIIAKEKDFTFEELRRIIKNLGFYTNDTVLPLTYQILGEAFGTTDSTTGFQVRRGAELFELEGFCYGHEPHYIGFIIEVRYNLQEAHIKHVIEQIHRFTAFCPRFKGMTLYGVIAVVDAISATMRQAVYDAGLYLVTVHDDVAEMPAPPQGFTPFSSIV